MRSFTVAPALRRAGGSLLVLALLTSPAGLAAGAARGQEKAASPKLSLLLSDNPEEYVPKVGLQKARSGDKPSVLWLRPNDEKPLWVFVKNVGAQARTVVVDLLDGSKGTTVATSGPHDVPGNGKETSLTLARPAAKEPGKAAPAKDEASPWVAGEGLPPQFKLRLSVAAKGEDPGEVEQVLVGILLPEHYLTATASYEAEKNRLSVTVTPKSYFTGGACPVEMVLDPATAALGPKGVFRRTLDLKADEEAELWAVSARFPDLKDKKGELSLTVDNYERAFVFPYDFGASGGKTPLKQDQAVVIRMPRQVAIPLADKYPIRFGMDNLLGLLSEKDREKGVEEDVAYETSLRLEVAENKGDKHPYFVKVLAGHRLRRVSVNPSAAGGAVAFKTEVRDWSVDVPVKGLVGKHHISVQARRGKEVVYLPNSTTPVEKEAALILDTPPEITAFGPSEEYRAKGGKKLRLKAGAPLKMVAEAAEAESGIERVVFFLGKPAPDPKQPDAFLLPDDAVKEEGKATGTKNTYAAELQGATDKPGTIDVSVLVVNGAGLKKFGTIKIELEAPAEGDANKPKGTTGKVSGTVLEGDRPQPKLAVQLLDAQGAVKGTATTDAAGKFKFEDVAPGAYRVLARKVASGRQGAANVEAVAGKEKTVEISLSR